MSNLTRIMKLYLGFIEIGSILWFSFSSLVNQKAK
jgi:hypothetical protein